MKIWLVESEVSKEMRVSDTLCGELAIRMIGSTKSLGRLLSMCDGRSKPDVIVISAEFEGSVDELTVASIALLLEYSFASTIVIVTQFANENWLRLSHSKAQSISFLDVCGLSAPEIVCFMESKVRQAVPRSHENEITNANVSVRSGASAIIDSTSLTPKERLILDLLSGTKGKCVTREQLIEALWPNVKVSQRNLDSHVSRLRRRLESESSYTIECEYGGGYKLIDQRAIG